jgi:hypothetical protein
MRKITLILSVMTVVMLTLSASHANALTFDQLPAEQSSKQWTVKVGKAGERKDYVKPQKGKFNTYSIEVDKLGKDVASVEINMFRNEPNSITKYSLLSCPNWEKCNSIKHNQAIKLAEQLNRKDPFRFENILLAEKASELEVVVTWTEKGNEGRPLKETFTFDGK